MTLSTRAWGLQRNLILANTKRSSSSSSTLDPRWCQLAAKQLRGKDPKTLVSSSAEGIDIKPIYTAQDGPADTSLPGEFPYTRGPYPTM